MLYENYLILPVPWASLSTWSIYRNGALLNRVNKLSYKQVVNALLPWTEKLHNILWKSCLGRNLRKCVFLRTTSIRQNRGMA